MQSGRSYPNIIVFEPNLNGRDIIIGDVHGNLIALLALLKTLHAGDRLFIVGDLVDKGQASAAVALKVLEVNSQPNMPRIYVTRGNHEELVIEAFNAYEKFVLNQAKEFVKKANADCFGTLTATIAHDFGCYLDEKCTVFPEAIVKHIKNYQGRWFTALFNEEIKLSKVIINPNSHIPELTFSSDSAIKKIVDYFKQLPFIIYTKPAPNIDEFYVVHGDLFTTHPVLQKRIAEMPGLIGDILSEDEKKYCLWARETPGHAYPILLNGRTPKMPRTYCGHTIAYINGVRAVDARVNRINLDMAMYLSEEFCVYVNHTEGSVHVIGEEDRERIVGHIRNAKELNVILKEIKDHLKPPFKKLYAIRDKIKQHIFTLNKLSGEQSGSAAKILTVLDYKLNPEDPKTGDECELFIRYQLTGKTTATTGFFGVGARHGTTAQLYTEILAILDGVTESSKIDIPNIEEPKGPQPP